MRGAADDLFGQAARVHRVPGRVQLARLSLPNKPPLSHHPLPAASPPQTLLVQLQQLDTGSWGDKEMEMLLAQAYQYYIIYGQQVSK